MNMHLRQGRSGGIHGAKDDLNEGSASKPVRAFGPQLYPPALLLGASLAGSFFAPGPVWGESSPPSGGEKTALVSRPVFNEMQPSAGEISFVGTTGQVNGKPAIIIEKFALPGGKSRVLAQPKTREFDIPEGARILLNGTESVSFDVQAVPAGARIQIIAKDDGTTGRLQPVTVQVSFTPTTEPQAKPGPIQTRTVAGLPHPVALEGTTLPRSIEKALKPVKFEDIQQQPFRIYEQRWHQYEIDLGPQGRNLGAGADIEPERLNGGFLFLVPGNYFPGTKGNESKILNSFTVWGKSEPQFYF
jgi:hypothetical protein